MVEADKPTMAGLHRLQERLFFIAQGMKAAGEQAIDSRDGLIDARFVFGAALQLEALEHDLTALVDG